MSDSFLVLLFCAVAFGPAVVIMLFAEFADEMSEDKPKKKERGKTIVVPDEPDTRVECPRCRMKKKMPLKKTEHFTISGQPKRRGYYKCDCGQWVCRVLQD